MQQEIVFTAETLNLIAFFEKLTKTTVRDCIVFPDKIAFVVDEGQGVLAVGKDGGNVIKASEMTRKSIRVVEYSPDPEKFVMNVFHVYGPQKVEITKNSHNVTHATVTVAPEHKGKAIGKEGSNLKVAREIIRRHHDIQSVNVG
ncbi:MAG: NusA-like transcription termination signal-binding factor [Thermoplasmatales archaeon]|nr:NusA-like transcription termination signal-binding factor [Thermoplasmatales archaeon]